MVNFSNATPLLPRRFGRYEYYFNRLPPIPWNIFDDGGFFLKVFINQT